MPTDQAYRALADQAFFDTASNEAADVNNSLPETTAMAEKMGHLANEGPSFSNIEAIARA